MATQDPGGERRDGEDQDSDTGAPARDGDTSGVRPSDPTVRFPSTPDPAEPPRPPAGADPTVRFGESEPTLPNPAAPFPAPTLPGTPDLPGMPPLPGLPDPLSGATQPVAATGESPGGAGESDPPRRMRGSMQRQEAGVTQPRPPTVAESRARDKARKRAEEAERAAAEALENKKRNKRKMLIGGVAVAGVAAVVGAGYLAYQAVHKPHVTASCITDDNGQQMVVSDDDCARAQQFAGTSGGYYGGYHSPGIFFYNGHQYRYYYGGNNTVGHPPSGGSTVAPKKATVSTKSGTVIRGGLGSKSGSSGGS
ncbi:hypothetical protein [Nocardia nova]|uniref:hypothetical protein n=1 Tax=Nocardia nova TaxID=37330 RepID=UPI0033F5F34B